MDVLTIKQLDEWMTANCYNNNSYEIGNRCVYEGFGLDNLGGLYVWYHTERDNRENLDYFRTEKEAVEFALKVITADKLANRHLVGFINDKSKEKELLSELDKRNIAYFKDEIPYGGFSNPRTRVFVFGCDIKKTLDLQEKYSAIK